MGKLVCQLIISHCLVGEGGGPFEENSNQGHIDFASISDLLHVT